MSNTSSHRNVGADPLGSVEYGGKSAGSGTVLFRTEISISAALIPSKWLCLTVCFFGYWLDTRSTPNANKDCIPVFLLNKSVYVRLDFTDEAHIESDEIHKERERE